jgi:hypothetical protein
MREDVANFTTRENLLARRLTPTDPNGLDLTVHRFCGTAKGEPSATIVMPIHFAGTHALENLSTAVGIADEPMDVCVVLDRCDSLEAGDVAHALLATPTARRIRDLLIFESEVDLFETSCDNVGFMSAETEFVIELQSDMRVLESGWDSKLLAPLRRYDQLFATSGRACHSWGWLASAGRASHASTAIQKVRGRLTGRYLPEKLTVASFWRSDAFGAVDVAGFEDATCLRSLPASSVFLSDSVNRGPLAIRRAPLASLGYLDESAYLLGGDEHDLTLRAWQRLRLRSAYVPLLVRSRREDSATAQPRTQATTDVLDRLVAVKEPQRRSSALGVFLSRSCTRRRPRRPPRAIWHLTDADSEKPRP